MHFGKRKWCIISLYRNEDVNPETFLNKLSQSLDQLLDSYENVMIIGDININSLDKSNCKFKHLKTFCESYDLTNLMKEPTCFQSENPTSIDVILTNKPRSFIHTKSVVNGLSDCHSLVMTMLKAQISKLAPIHISYRNFKDFDEHAFNSDLGHAISQIDFDQDSNDTKLFEIYSAIAEKHAPMKTKVLRGNDAPFMTNALRREIKHRSRLRNISLKENTSASKRAYCSQRNKCTKLRRENMNAFLKKASIAGRNSKSYWKTINPFLTNKGSHGKEDYILEENNKLIKDPNEIGELFIDYYTNIVEHATGIPPVDIPLPEDGDLIDTLLSHYENHSSIHNIKNMNINTPFSIPLADEETIGDIMRKLDTSKATGIDAIPARLIKISADVGKKPFTKIINKSIERSIYPNLMKIVKITPIYKLSLIHI